MKILTTIINTIMAMAFIAFCVFVATFFLSMFIPDEVLRAVEIFKSLFG